MKRPGSPNRDTSICTIAKKVKLVKIVVKINCGIFATSSPNPHTTIAIVNNDWIIPTPINTDTLLINQLAPFFGIIAGSTSGNTIEINNAPTNKPNEIK